MDDGDLGSPLRTKRPKQDGFDPTSPDSLNEEERPHWVPAARQDRTPPDSLSGYSGCALPDAPRTTGASFIIYRDETHVEGASNPSVTQSSPEVNPALGIDSPRQDDIDIFPSAGLYTGRRGKGHKEGSTVTVQMAGRSPFARSDPELPNVSLTVGTKDLNDESLSPMTSVQSTGMHTEEQGGIKEGHRESRRSIDNQSTGESIWGRSEALASLSILAGLGFAICGMAYHHLRSAVEEAGET
jgi:hypothetical protein